MGEECFYDFLLWEEGGFSFEPSDNVPDTRAFRRDTTSLLLEGMRRLDEA